MIFLIYVFNYTLLFSCFLDMRFKDADRRFSFGLVRIFFLVPLLSAEYLYFGAQMSRLIVAPLFFSEIVFALTWIGLAYNLPLVVNPNVKKSMPYRLATIVGISGIFCIGSYWLISRPVFKITGNDLILPYHGQLYFSSLFVLIAVLVMAWRAEAFWRILNQKDRKQYKYLLIGFFLITGSLGWSSSYRIAYLRLISNHLLLVSIFLIIAWFLIAYAVTRHRLLNRKIFVSRKVVYSTIAPFIFACYLITLGIISLLMRFFGWPMNFVLQWLLIVAGLLLIAAFALSQRVRAKVKFFISTHFYVNKYEYRDEWLAFSNILQGELTEIGVVHALRRILHDSLYTDKIKIWIGDAEVGFRLTDAEDNQNRNEDAFISADDPLIVYLQNAPYLDCKAHHPDSACQRILDEKKDFITSLELVLLVPLAISDHFIGVIGLGLEYTGGRYGTDDFDLLSAIGSQAASALLAVRTAEALAKAREQSAWNTLSAFVLHDIKNAANMLSLVKENAPQHIHDPEFQQDMLTSVEDALKRMAKVQARLNTLKGEIIPVMKELDICQLLRNYSQDFGKKLPGLTINVQGPQEVNVKTDPDFLLIIFENLILNSVESGSGETRVQIKIDENENEQHIRIEYLDNGPGIPLDMLPDRLFEPFITGKPKGSGIGLWQVRRLIESLCGKIEAQNVEGQGARFLVWLPSGREK